MNDIKEMSLIELYTGILDLEYTALVVGSLTRGYEEDEAKIASLHKEWAGLMMRLSSMRFELFRRELL